MTDSMRDHQTSIKSNNRRENGHMKTLKGILFQTFNSEKL